MLTLARVESGPSAAGGPATCDLPACVHTSVTQLDTVAALRNISIDVRAPGSRRVPLAAEDCAVLIENLLMNALQHSQRGSRVEINADEHDGVIDLSVLDYGEGIDPAALPHIFDRFYRGDPSRTRSTGGAGLGLAICKAVAEKAGGTINMKSEVGRGTTVTVRLPRAI